MSFPAYPEYKDSGVPWLGAVPGHWELSRIGSRFTERREKVSDTDFPPLSVTKHGIVPQLETAAKTDDNDNRKGVRAGDFVINSRSDRKGSSGLSSLDGSVSLINTVIRADDTMHGAFVHHLLRSVAFQEEYYRYGKGIVADLWSTNYGEMKAITLAVPPIGEQEAIAAFLDRETAKIDALVAEQERLIALLKEKRQAVISHAVTKGLNPHAPMKDSGIEWLGEIPAHWEATTLRRCCLNVQTGGTPSSVSPAEDIDGVPWFTPGDFKNFRLQDSAKKTTNDTVESGECRLFPKGCVLIVSIGATLGKLGVPSGPCSANQQINAIMPRDSLKTDWLAYSLSVMTDFMKFISNASTIGIMNQEKTKEIPIALPPIDEQDRITSYLEQQSANFDGLVAEAQAAITLLQERRAALISAAVTGKIDVRGLVDAPAEMEAA